MRLLKHIGKSGPIFYFQDMIRIEPRRSHRHQIPILLMMIDIDHFKSFKDRYGHPRSD